VIAGYEKRFAQGLMPSGERAHEGTDTDYIAEMKTLRFLTRGAGKKLSGKRTL